MGRIVEEILSYMRSTFALDSIGTVECVQQLLKCLFGTNLTAHISDVNVGNRKVSISDNDEVSELVVFFRFCYFFFFL